MHVIDGYLSMADGIYIYIPQVHRHSTYLMNFLIRSAFIVHRGLFGFFLIDWNGIMAWNGIESVSILNRDIVTAARYLL